MEHNWNGISVDKKCKFTKDYGWQSCKRVNQNKMNNYAIIQARLNSLRLPNKILKKIDKHTALEILIKRLKKSKIKKKIIIATNSKSIKKLQIITKKYNLDVFEGDDKNVLRRYFSCSKKFKLKDNDNIIRITADCPFIDSKLIDKGLKLINSQNVSLVSNTQKLTYPDGLDFSIFKFKLLKKTYKEAKSEYDKEHVTSYMYKIKNLKKLNIEDSENYSNIRLTLDTKSDLNFLRFILKKAKKNIFFSYTELKLILKKISNKDKKKFKIFFDAKKIRNSGGKMSKRYKLWVRLNL